MGSLGRLGYDYSQCAPGFSNPNQKVQELFHFCIVGMYSRLSNKRDGWNKRDGRKVLQKFGLKVHSPPTNFKFKCIFGIF